MNFNEEKFLELAIYQNIIKESDIDNIIELQKKNGLSLFSIMLKEKILTVEQISKLQKSLMASTIHENKTVSQATSTLNEQKTLAQDKEQKEKPYLSQIDDQKHFGRYSILDNLGEGGMGVVYKAYDPSLDRIVALKLITSSRQQNQTAIDRFIIEAKATAKLNHEHIVKIHDMGTEKGIYFFTMEFIQGDTLEKQMKEKKISRQNALRLLIKVCKAIDYSHSNGIIHRDLKPGNIMIDSANEPRIMDFGLAKLEKENKKLSRTGAPIGTPAYMSPEQAAGKDIGHLSDVYSLGAILYKILTGIEPFRGDTLLKILQAVQQNDPVPPGKIRPGISHDLEIICQKAMAKEQERRYQSAKELAEDLENFLEGEPIKARPASLYYRVSRKFKKNKAISAMICLCFLLGFGSLFFFWQEQSKRFQKSQETIEKYFFKAKKFSFPEKAIASQERLESPIRKEMHQASREYSFALNALENSEYKSKFILLQSESQNKRDSLLDMLYGDALSCYKNHLCQTALTLYQDIRNTLYIVKESKISREKIDTEISHLYQWILEAERAKDQAKNIAYNTHSSNEDISKAIILLTNALEKNQENSDAFFLRGLLRFRISQKVDALKDFQRCLSLEENHFPAKYYTIKLEIKIYLKSSEKQKYLDQYIAKFLPSLEKASKDQKTYFYLIQAYQLKFQHNRYEAEQKILLAQKESPLLAEAYYTQANFLSYFLTGEETIAFDWDAFFETVSVFYNYERANKAIQRCLELDPNNPPALLLQGKLAWDAFATQKAIENFSKVIEYQPTEYLHFLRGCAYLDLEKYDLALKDFETLITRFKLSDTFIECILFLLLEKQGKREEAEKLLDNWKQKSFEIDRESFYQYMISAYREKPVEFYLTKDAKIDHNYSCTKIFLFFHIPFVFLSFRANVDNHISLENLAIPPKRDSTRFIDFFIKDSKRYAHIMMEKDIFLSQRSVNDFYFLDEMKKIVRNLDIPGNQPSEMYYNSSFHFFLKMLLNDEKTLLKMNKILEKFKSSKVEMLLTLLARAAIIRQQYLLCRQDILDFSDSYYHRSMYYFSKKEWDNAIQDMNMALYLSPRDNRYHYALAKILAYQMLVYKYENTDKVLYHIEQAFSMGLQPLHLPLGDPAFDRLKDSVSILLKKYEGFADQNLWKNLWALQQKKDYNSFYQLTKGLTLNASVIPFLSYMEREEINQYYQNLAKLNSMRQQGKNISQVAETLQKIHSPYWQAKIQEKSQHLALGFCKKIRVALDNTGDFKNIQNAIDIASEGTTIELDPGLYEGSLVLKTGITIRGTLNEKGEPASILRHPLKGASLSAIEMNKIQFLDCEFQSDFYFRHSEVSFHNCNIFSTGYLSRSAKTFSIYIYGNSQVTIEKSQFKASIKCFDQSRLIIKDSQLQNCQELQIELFDSCTGLFQGNEMYKALSHGSDYILFFHDSSKAIVLQNTIHHTRIGIYIADNADADIIENKIYSTKTGIFITDNASCRINKNEIYRNLEYGISIPEKNKISLENNIFKENKKENIEKRKQ